MTIARINPRNVGECVTCGNVGDVNADLKCAHCEAMRVVVDFDWQGMARDLSASLSEANRNLDRMIPAMIDAAEALHATHKTRAVWQDCPDPFCRKVVDLLSSLGDSKGAKNGGS